MADTHCTFEKQYMTGQLETRYQVLNAALASAGQAHVFAYWNELPEDRKAQLLDDLECINLQQLPRLCQLVIEPGPEQTVSKGIKPATVFSRHSVSVDTINRGRALLAEGKVAALTVAGGQGTRLGFDGPKGAFQISPIKNKSLFQLFAESILATERRYETRIPWYIMTSPSNDEATRAFFGEHRFFGLTQDRVSFFRQGVMPSFDPDGRILLEQKHRVALSPDGHGGTLLAMATTGVLTSMAAQGIEYISYFQVDNPLVMCLDPVFIGLHAEGGSDMSSKAVPKADDFERVGNFISIDGRLEVIEYSDLSDEFARARNEDGSRKFDAANIAVHILSRTFVERLTADQTSFALPWHTAKKKVPHIDLNTGRRFEPTEPNAVKLESFIFDALPLAANSILLETTREEEFSPVKNNSGIDSVETSRRDQNRRAARWLEAAGLTVPRDDHGEPSGTFEISPLTALEAEYLVQRAESGDIRLPQSLSHGADYYLED